MSPCSVLLLAGGRGQRMGGLDKGLLEWRAEPMIAHLHRLVRPFSDDVIISCNRNHERYAEFADRLVSDEALDFPGPLAGIRAGLAAARHDHLLVLPCDMPLLDHALLQTLLGIGAAHRTRPVIVRQGEQWQPLICLLPLAHRAAFEHAWQAGERSPRHVMLKLDPLALDCAVDDPRLANLNSPDRLQADR
jgi:molybdopterin-guanine dinucleotide biosynthesis protein A